MTSTSSSGLAAEDTTTMTLLDAAVAELGGSPRDGQRRMVSEVSACLTADKHLMVQAGTGTGKSLGYLVPAVQHAVEQDVKVLVSTATLALQRQIMTRDLPLVKRALTPHLGSSPRVALLKGWQNYLCLHKVAGGYPVEDTNVLFDLDPGASQTPVAADHPRSEQTTPLAREITRLRHWSAETATGDRDDLIPGVSDRAWRQVSVTALECIGAKCPMLSECFAEQARTTARAADVVVTNHAMLGIAAEGNNKVLPEYDVLMVDEAHELADRITQQSTVELSIGSIETAARLARRHGGVGTSALDDAATHLAAALVQLPDQRFANGLPEELRTIVQTIRDAARNLLTELKPSQGDNTETAATGTKMAHAAMSVLLDIGERMTQDPDGHSVIWSARPLDNTGEASPARLFMAPLNISGLIRTKLLNDAVGVFTSATLTLGGTFEPIAGSLGLTTPEQTPGEAAPTWTGLDVGTPFDYAKQGILYIAKHLPAPGREPTTQAQLDEIADLITAASGRTLGLFSSRRAAQLVATEMRNRLDVPILCQGDDQLPTLVEQFAQDPQTCLFGTLSLWQGVDVPGPTCSLVLIDRIPFPRPDDPVRSARSEQIARSGGNGFMQVAATHAALLLAQGAGRLIRTSSDKGVVAVLDPRLATARYGSFLTRSMPRLWLTTDRHQVTAALQRLVAAEPATSTTTPQNR